MKNKKNKIKYNENLKIKISKTDIDNFPTHTLVVDEFWKSVYEGGN